MSHSLIHLLRDQVSDPAGNRENGRIDGLTRDVQLSHTQNPLHTFSCNFPVDREVANLLAASHYNGIWETTQQTQRSFARAKFANLLQTCYGDVANLLQSFYGYATEKLV